MKAVLAYDASPTVRAIIAGADRAAVEIVHLTEDDEARYLRELADAEVLLHVLAPVTRTVMDAAPSLRLVQKIGVGVDAIDLAHARARGIAVCNMPGTNTAAVAELALALMLACLRHIVPIATDMRAGRGWPARLDLLDRAGEIGQRTVGLIGYGAVSRRLATALQALGARVVVHDPFVTDAEVTLLPLDALLREADIVSLHAPLTDETRGLLSHARLALMKRGAIVINTARGPLIDEPALAAMLKDGHIAAAGLDVFAAEPPPVDNPLIGLENVIATPHIAWLTDGTWRRSVDVVVENCRRLAAGTPLLHRVT
jgi:phosphoglycerate dehydrogenase-like enzyme